MLASFIIYIVFILYIYINSMILRRNLTRTLTTFELLIAFLVLKVRRWRQAERDISGLSSRRVILINVYIMLLKYDLIIFRLASINYPAYRDCVFT